MKPKSILAAPIATLAGSVQISRRSCLPGWGRFLGLGLAVAITGLHSAEAAPKTWLAAPVDGNWANGTNWGGTAPVASDALFFGASTITTLNNNLTAGTSLAGLTFNLGASAFTIGGNAITLNGGITNNSANLQTINTAFTLGATQTITTGTGGLTLGGSISGATFGLTKAGPGLLTLTGANAYTGATTINAGTLKLDFSAAGAPATNIISNSSALKLGGGKLQILGAAAGSTQTFASTSFTGNTGGLNVISAAPTSGGTNPTINLGTLTGAQGALVRFDGAAYNDGASSGTTVGGNTIAATATFNTTTNTIGAGLISSSTVAGTGANAYATVGLYDWAAISGGTVGTAQTGTVVGGSQIANFYTVANGVLPGNVFGGNYDITANATMDNNSTSTTAAYSTFRFNTNAAIAVGTGRTLAGAIVGGMLVTPNVGTNNVSINAGTVAFQASRSANGATGLTLWQNNTAGELIINATYNNGSNSAATANLVQGGAGTVVLNAANGYTGQTYLNGGTTVIVANSGIGATATAATLNLNGGTLFGNGSFALDNGGGANPRPVFLNGAGGTLAAKTSNILTVNGVISGAADLSLGMGTVAGTGAGTANAAALVGDGTVTLTGVNTYTGATTINGGALILSGTGSIATSSNVALNSGTFSGRGTVGPTTVANASSNLLTNTSGNVLTLGSLTFNGAATLGLNLSAAPAITVTGALTTTPANGQVTINATNTLWANGLNNLLGYSTFSGSVSDFTMGTFSGFSGRQAAGSLQLNGSNLALNVIGDTPVWTGANGGLWIQYAQNTPTSATPSFALKTSHTATDFWTADNAEFNDTYNLGAGDVAVTVPTITIHNGSVSPTALVFNNSAVNYTVTSDDGSGIAAGSLTKSGTGTLSLNTVNTYTGGTTINAGTITINSADSLGAVSSATTINAATLRSTANIASLRNFTLGTATSTILVDPGTTYALGGVIGGTGSLNKTGTGTLTLSGANTFTGDLNVNAGLLVANLASNTANATATALGNPQNAGRSVNVNNGTTLRFDSGDTLGGATSVILSPLVINAGGTVTNGGGVFNTLGPVTLNGATLTGIGGANAAYQMYNLRGAVTVGGSSASTISGSGTNAGYHLAAPTIFNVADVTGDALTDLNVSATLLDQDATHTGVGSLTKTGAGTMVLTAANTHSGTTTISAGLLRLDNANALQNSTASVGVDNGLAFGTGITAVNLGGLAGTNALDLINSDNNAVALSVGNNGTASTYSGLLSGAGTLTKVGAGALTLSNNANTYSGTTTLSAGTLSLGSNTNFGTGGIGSGAIVFQGGTLSHGYNTSNTLIYNNAMSVATAQTGTITTPNRFRFNSAISGDGTLNFGINTSVSRADFQNDFSAFSGAVNFTGTGTVRLGLQPLATGQPNFTGAGWAGTTLSVDGVFVSPATATGGNTLTIGALTSTGTTGTLGGGTAGTVIYAVGAKNLSTVFGGKITGNAALTKTGSGSLTLTNVNDYTGATTVSAGTLVVSGSISGATTVNGTGTLGGTGTTGLVTVATGGTLAPGVGVGQLNTGALALNGTAVFQLELNIAAANSVTNDLANVTGDLDLALGKTAVLSLSNLGLNVALEGGTTLTVIDYSGNWNGGTFAGLADDSFFNFGANQFQISYNGLNGSDTAVTLLAIPEPTSATLLFAALGALSGLRRFRRRSN